MAFKNEHEFGDVSKLILDRFGDDLGTQNGAKIVLKSASRAIMKKMQKC